MLKRLFSSLLIFSLITVQAFAVSHNGLKEAFDELNYALTVEWDQSNQDFYQTQMNKFHTSLKDLQKMGLSDQDIRDFALNQIKDRQIVEDLKVVFQTIGYSNMPLEEAKQLLNDVMKNSYERGASWHASGIVKFALITVLAFAILFTYYELDS